MTFYIVPDSTLTALAELIRVKSGINRKLSFPTDFMKMIEQLSSLNADYDFFSGSYDIIPTIDPQILETEGKIMEQNLTIREIPYYEVSNSSGYTVYIGGDLNA